MCHKCRDRQHEDDKRPLYTEEEANEEFERRWAEMNQHTDGAIDRLGELLPDKLAEMKEEARVKLVEMLTKRTIGSEFDSMVDFIDDLHKEGPNGEKAHGTISIKVSRHAVPALLQLLELGQKVVRRYQLDFSLIARVDATYYRAMEGDAEAFATLPVLMAEYDEEDGTKWSFPLDEFGNPDRDAVDLNDNNVKAVIDHSRRLCKALLFASNAEVTALPRLIEREILLAEAERGSIGGSNIPVAMVEGADSLVRRAFARDCEMHEAEHPGWESQVRIDDPTYDDTIDMTNLFGDGEDFKYGPRPDDA